MNSGDLWAEWRAQGAHRNEDGGPILLEDDGCPLGATNDCEGCPWYVNNTCTHPEAISEEEKREKGGLQ